MRRFVFTGDSGANAEKTHTPQIPTNTEYINIESLTISSTGGDVASDVTIEIKDAGNTVWKAALRSGKEYGRHFTNIGAFPLNGTLTIVTAAGGASVVVTTSMIYQTFITDY